jgi:hypothetical protein
VHDSLLRVDAMMDRRSPFLESDWIVGASGNSLSLLRHESKGGAPV